MTGLDRICVLIGALATFEAVAGARVASFRVALARVALARVWAVPVT